MAIALNTMIDITQLYTRYPEDIKKVVDAPLRLPKRRALKTQV